MKKLIFTLLMSFNCIQASGTQKHFNPSDSGRIIKEINILKSGRRISAELLKELGGTLKNSIRKKGLVDSIGMCSVSALPLTEKLRKKHDLKSIKRVSEKLRNPENAPDELDTFAMKHLQKEKLSSYLQQQVKGGKFYYRFYQAIGVKSSCLPCHGVKKDMKTTVRKKLERIYPNDQATGYKIDDFRGVIRLQF